MENQTMVKLENIDPLNQALSGEYPIEQAQQILQMDKKQRQKNWKLSPDQSFTLKADGTIIPANNTEATTAANDSSNNPGN